MNTFGQNQNQSNFLGNSNNTQWGMNNEQPNNINSGYGQTNTQPQAYNIFGNNIECLEKICLLPNCNNT